MASATPTVAEFMTSGPQSIGMEQTLEEAHRVMREHRIRHLPVLEGGRLVGIVSQRDLHLIETFRDVDGQTVTVEEAMTSDPYIVKPKDPLAKVALEMWKKKYGSAVVMDGRRLVGVFTTTDALGALAVIIHREARPVPKAPAKKKPTAARKASARKVARR
jgi:acetoin utilization protein AcuB